MLGLLLIAPPVPDLSDNFSREFASLAPVQVAPLSFISAAQAQTDTLANSPSDPVKAYNNALDRFKSTLRERRAQIDSNRQLPNLLGQALYVARNEMISTYKDLTDALPSKIGRPNRLVERFQSSNHMGCSKRPHPEDGKPKMQLSGFMELVV